MRRLVTPVLILVVALLATGCTGFVWGVVPPSVGQTDPISPTVTSDNILDVAAGADHSCELRSDRSVWCSGDNRWGQLGTGDLEAVDGAIQVGEATDWTSITGGEVHTCGIRPGNELWCWGGYPHHDQHPDGTLITPNPPVEVAGDHEWRSVAPSAEHTCGILTDGSLMCWGLNTWGQVGDGTTNIVEEPTVITEGQWLSVATGYYNNCAIKDDGTLWCWGRNSHPYPSTDPLVPTQLGTDTTWSSVAGREGHYCATRTDGTLWCWLRNDDGQAGTGSDIEHYYELPVQVGTDTDWRSVDTGPTHTCATRLDWSLWCWGRNGDGQVGDGTTDDALSPVLIDDSQRWLGFELSYEFTVAFSVP